VPAKDYLNKNQWSKQDKQNFADKNILKAKTVPGKKKPPPNKKEWD
jgi:hypothetical protein